MAEDGADEEGVGDAGFDGGGVVFGVEGGEDDLGTGSAVGGRGEDRVLGEGEKGGSSMVRVLTLDMVMRLFWSD